MAEAKSATVRLFERGFAGLGALAAIGLVGYAGTYLVVMPAVSPTGFVPTAVGTAAGSGPDFGAVAAAFALLYALAFLPVTTRVTIRQYRVNPSGVVLAGCLAGVSSLIEILNNLPVVAAAVYPLRAQPVSPDVLLRLQQIDAVRFLAFDVAGFSLGYAAVCLYAVVFFRTHRLLSVASVASIGLFVANVPCLWFAPRAAVVLMAASILAFALVAILLSRLGDA